MDTITRPQADGHLLMIHDELADDRPAQSAQPVEAQSVVSVVEKAMALLDAFGTERSVFGVSELARRAGLPKSTTHRLLGVLLRCGMVARHGDGYRWGPRLHEIADRLDCRYPGELREKLLPYLADAYVLTRQTVALGVLRDREVVAVGVLKGRRPVPAPTGEDHRCPLHCTAIGKVLLAYGSEALRRRVLSGDLPAFTRSTIASAAILATELERVRRRGIAFANEEYVEGVRSVAVPIFGVDRSVVAALEISGPVDDFQPHVVVEAATRIAQAASRALRLHDATEPRLAERLTS